jgi:hypothetical protein
MIASGAGSRRQDRSIRPSESFTVSKSNLRRRQTFGHFQADNDIRFMQEALRVATQDGADPALSPIGCVIVMAGEIIPAERNHVADLIRGK